MIDDFIKQHDIVKLQAIAHQHIKEKNSKNHFIPEHLDKWGKQSLQTAIDQMPMIIKDLDHVSPRKHKKLYALNIYLTSMVFQLYRFLYTCSALRQRGKDMDVCNLYRS